MKKGLISLFINTIKSILLDNWPILIIFTVSMIFVRFFYLRSHREKISFYKELLMLISICYIFLLFQLLTKVEMNSNSGFNIIPFQEIFRYEIGSRLFIFNVLGNIMAFVLFGLIVSNYIKPKTAFAPLVISFLVSATVEFVQLNIGRSFDVDDIILNVIGGIIGFLLYIGWTAIKKHLPKIFQSDTFYNIICVILIIVLLIYLVNVMGVVNL